MSLAVDTRRKDKRWTVTDAAGINVSWDGAQLAVLMDIRDELKRLNSLLYCPNFTSIPAILRSVRRNTTKPKRRKKP